MIFLLKKEELIGKTIAGISFDFQVIAFTDKTYTALNLDYSTCYYEGDIPEIDIDTYAREDKSVLASAKQLWENWNES